jgi:hypothetical protein
MQRDLSGPKRRSTSPRFQSGNPAGRRTTAGVSTTQRAKTKAPNSRRGRSKAREGHEGGRLRHRPRRARGDRDPSPIGDWAQECHHSHGGIPRHAACDGKRGERDQFRSGLGLRGGRVRDRLAKALPRFDHGFAGTPLPDAGRQASHRLCGLQLVSVLCCNSLAPCGRAFAFRLVQGPAHHIIGKSHGGTGPGYEQR